MGLEIGFAETSSARKGEMMRLKIFISDRIRSSLTIEIVISDRDERRSKF